MGAPSGAGSGPPPNLTFSLQPAVSTGSGEKEQPRGAYIVLKELQSELRKEDRAWSPGIGNPGGLCGCFLRAP